MILLILFVTIQVKQLITPPVNFNIVLWSKVLYALSSKFEDLWARVNVEMKKYVWDDERTTLKVQNKIISRS